MSVMIALGMSKWLLRAHNSHWNNFSCYYDRDHLPPRSKTSWLRGEHQRSILVDFTCVGSCASLRWLVRVETNILVINRYNFRRGQRKRAGIRVGQALPLHPLRVPYDMCCRMRNIMIDRETVKN